jgi:hypothetical protein
MIGTLGFRVLGGYKVNDPTKGYGPNIPQANGVATGEATWEL